MNYQLSAKQAFVLWQLLLHGDDVALSKLDPSLTPAERKPLLDAGLIDLAPRGRSKHVVLTDKAWLWAVEQGEIAIYPSKKHAPRLLQTLLNKVQGYLQTNAIPLTEFLTAQPIARGVEHTDTRNNQTVTSATVNSFTDFAAMATAIRTAYRQITGGKVNLRVRLSELHKGLPLVPKTLLDATLRQMQLNGELVLMPLDDPKGVYAEDQVAAVNIAGEFHHIVYLKG
ncbi:MAG: hypothetical protein ACOYNY_18410 [Caldilineaceae bacterium]